MSENTAALPFNNSFAPKGQAWSPFVSQMNQATGMMSNMTSTGPGDVNLYQDRIEVQFPRMFWRLFRGWPTITGAKNELVTPGTVALRLHGQGVHTATSTTLTLSAAVSEYVYLKHVWASASATWEHSQNLPNSDSNTLYWPYFAFGHDAAKDRYLWSAIYHLGDAQMGTPMR